jgi:hypothetical protein
MLSANELQSTTLPARRHERSAPPPVTRLLFSRFFHEVSLLPFTYPRPVCQHLLKSPSRSQHSELLFLSQCHLFPLLLRTLSGRSAFPPQHPRCLKQFTSKLETEAEVVLTLLIKLIGGRSTPVSLDLPELTRGSRWRSRTSKISLYTSFWRTGSLVTMRSAIRLQPGQLTSHPALRLCADAWCGYTCEQLSIALS